MKTLSLSILSGKGGVGKTNLALNLGYALYKANHSVMLMDCDIGLANLDILLGLTPEKNIHDLLQPGISPRDVILPIEQNGFDFLPAASGIPDLLEMDEDLQSVLFEKMNAMLDPYDFLLLDLGAGISRTVLSFTAITHERILVITPEPTSLTDGYAMIKVLNSEYGVKSFHIVVNQVASQNEGKRSFERLNAACEKFLDFKIQYIGSIRTDSAMCEAVVKQVPLLRLAPKSTAARDILALAVKLKRMREEKLPLLAGQKALQNFPVNNVE